MTRTKPLILVIDDDPDIRRSLSRELALAGYGTVTAADGVEGPELFEHHQPDLVITDVAMPRADGFAVISAVRPRIWLSAPRSCALTARPSWCCRCAARRRIRSAPWTWGRTTM